MNEARHPKKSEHLNPLVAILQDGIVRADRLRQVLERLRCRVLDVFPNASAAELRSLHRHADLIAVSIDSERPETIDRLQTLMTPDGNVPVLALARREDIARCLDWSRHSGVAALLSTDASLSHIEFRLNNILDVFPERRLQERVSILLPVKVHAEGAESFECAVALSRGGMGIASRRPLTTGCRLDLELRPTTEEPITLPGSVIHCLEEPASLPPFRIGIRFLNPSSAAQQRLESLIARESH